MNDLFSAINNGNINKDMIDKVDKDDTYNGHTYLTFTYQYYLDNPEVKIDLDFIKNLLKLGVNVNKFRDISVNNYVIALQKNGYVDKNHNNGDHVNLLESYKLNFKIGDYIYGEPLEYAREYYKKHLKNIKSNNL